MQRITHFVKDVAMISRNIYIGFSAIVSNPVSQEELINIPVVEGRFIEDLINLAYGIRTLDDDERMDIDITILTEPFSTNFDQEDQRLPI